MSIVGFPPTPAPFVTAMLEDPAVIVRSVVTPGDVSTTMPLLPGSLNPAPPHVSVPDEFIQHTPTPDFAYTRR
jgi:hypothetical protein